MNIENNQKKDGFAIIFTPFRDFIIFLLLCLFTIYLSLSTFSDIFNQSIIPTLSSSYSSIVYNSIVLLLSLCSYLFFSSKERNNNVEHFASIASLFLCILSTISLFHDVFTSHSLSSVSQLMIMILIFSMYAVILLFILSKDLR